MSGLPKKPVQGSGPAPNSNPAFKRAKLYNSRQIRTQLQDDAFTNPPKGATSVAQVRKILANGGSQIPNKLNIPDFLSAREFEIKALDSAMIKSKTSGASRVFQALPRSLRRRTASHNVRRIPKRMRKKALREMGIQSTALGSKEMVGTKGVTPTGKPLKKKIGRGRERWAIIRKLRLLKYAARYKLKGTLPNSQWVSIQQINLRRKYQLLRKNLAELNKSNDDDQTKDPVSNPTVKKEITRIVELSNNVRNKMGSYDNTSVNSLCKITKINCIQYADRQRQFKWLPTHVWHAKRAKMTKRWGWNIPNEPTQRCYRHTSRSSRVKGAVIFDTSYYGNFVINSYSKEAQSLVEGYLKRITDGKIALKKCKTKNISWSGFVYSNSTADNEVKNPIGVMQVVVVPTGNGSKILGRMHPSIYPLVYNEIVSQFEAEVHITVHDCNYSIGSFDLTGPKSLAVLQSIFYNTIEKSHNFHTFMNLHKLNDLTSVPEGTVFAFNVCDPRFKTKPTLPTNPKIDYDGQLDILISLRNSPHDINSDLLDFEKRASSYDQQMTLKDLGRRRNLHPGEAIPVRDSDSQISVMLIKSSDKWTVLLPWFWVLPFWHTLVHVPHVQLGGIKQMEQLSYERGQLGWSDMVFTDSGFIQCEIERETAEKKWNERPKSKRVAYDKLILANGEKSEILSPFGLDWRGLQTLRLVVKRLTADGNMVSKNKKSLRTDVNGNIVVESVEDIKPVVNMIQSAEKQMKEKNMHKFLAEHKPIVLHTKKSKLDLGDFNFNIKDMPSLSIVPVKLTCISKGNIKPNARVYTVPNQHERHWIEIATGDLKNINDRIVNPAALPNYKQYLPTVDTTVGLVSSASFNLVDGICTCSAFVDADVVGVEDSGLLLVRNVASSLFTLVKWKRLDLSKF